MSPEELEHTAGSARSKTLARWVASSLSVAVVLVAWWWPGLSGEGSEPEVAVIGTGEIAKAREEVSRRLREAGLSVSWVASVQSWCDFTDAYADLDDETVIMAPEDLRPCGDESDRFVRSLSGVSARRLVVVSLDQEPTDDIEFASLVDAGARRVPSERLIGAFDERMPCLWWDDCPPEGSIVTRTENGLTPAGRQRLARLLVTQIS